MARTDKRMNVPEIRRNMHLAHANLTPEELEASQWPVIKFLLEVWDADDRARGQIVTEREEAWNVADRYRQEVDRAREANALLVEELAVARGRAQRPVPTCVFVWEDGWQPLPVRGEEGWAPAVPGPGDGDVG